MIKLGITGNIASGKTLIESFLKEEGIATIDADEIVHDLLNNDKETIDQVQNIFLPEIDVRNDQGGIDRKKVGNIVFKDKNKLKKLENILHPAVKRKIENFFCRNKDKKIAAAVVPLLFEIHMEDKFDYIVLVTVNKPIQLERLMKRSNLTESEAMLRINAQMPQDEKIKKADFIVDNSYNTENAKSQTIELLRRLNNLV